VRGDRAKMAEAAKTAHEQVRAILTPEQQKEFDTMKPEGRGGKRARKPAASPERDRIDRRSSTPQSDDCGFFLPGNRAETTRRVTIVALLRHV